MTARRGLEHPEGVAIALSEALHLFARAIYNIHVSHVRSDFIDIILHIYIYMYLYVYIYIYISTWPEEGITIHEGRRIGSTRPDPRLKMGQSVFTPLGERDGDSHQASNIYQHRNVVGEPRQREGAVTSCRLRCPRARPLNWHRFVVPYAF
jgi:hypothetical protein